MAVDAFACGLVAMAALRFRRVGHVDFAIASMMVFLSPDTQVLLARAYDSTLPQLRIRGYLAVGKRLLAEKNIEAQSDDA